PVIKLKTTVLMYPPSEKNRNKIILRYNSELIEFEDSVGDITCLFELLKSGHEYTDIKLIFLHFHIHHFLNIWKQWTRWDLSSKRM
ncbi:hypothetical protein D4T05_27390, partial [Salmonella enterica]|nr:hypothetical protein [Salmonella enterica]